MRRSLDGVLHASGRPELRLAPIVSPKAAAAADAGVGVRSVARRMAAEREQTEEDSAQREEHGSALDSSRVHSGMGAVSSMSRASLASSSVKILSEVADLREARGPFTSGPLTDISEFEEAARLLNPSPEASEDPLEILPRQWSGNGPANSTPPVALEAAACAAQEAATQAQSEEGTSRGLGCGRPCSGPLQAAAALVTAASPVCLSARLGPHEHAACTDNACRHCGTDGRRRQQCGASAIAEAYLGRGRGPVKALRDLACCSGSRRVLGQQALARSAASSLLCDAGAGIFSQKVLDVAAQ